MINPSKYIATAKSSKFVKSAVFAIVAIALSLPLDSCSSKGAGDPKPVICVSIEPQRKLLDELVGDNFTTMAILSNGANPETFDPSMSTRIAANNAKAIFITGYLPYEQSVVTGKTVVYNTSDGIEALTGTHSHNDDSDDFLDALEPDPHVWTSVRNAKIMAANMVAALEDIDPDNAQLYQQRYQTMAQRLDSLDNALASQLHQAGVHAFAIWHPSLSYFANDYGLHQISVGQESKEASLNDLVSVINEVKEDSATVFFYQKEFDSRQAKGLSKEMGTRLVEISPMEYDWENQLKIIADELTK